MVARNTTPIKTLSAVLLREIKRTTYKGVELIHAKSDHNGKFYVYTEMSPLFKVYDPSEANATKRARACVDRHFEQVEEEAARRKSRK